MKLLTKGWVIVAIPSLFEVVLLASLFKMQADAEDAERWAAHSASVMNQASEVREPMLLESARIRNAVLINDPTPISRPEMWADVDAKLGELQTMVEDNAAQSAAVAGLRESVANYRTWADSARQRMQDGQREAVIAQLRDEAGPHRLAEFRSRLARFIDTERQLAAERNEDLQDARQSQTMVLIAAVVGSILAAGLASYAFTSNIGKRVEVLTENARRLADGSELAQRVRGDDEISQLDDVLHRTSDRLQRANDEALRYRTEIEQRARELDELNTHLRAQTQDNEMFIYSVSHDLRSPLVNLQGFSKEIMHATRDLSTEIAALDVPAANKRRIQELIDDDLHTSLRFIQNAVTRAAGIIDAMLRLSRAGRVEYLPVMTDINAIAQRIVDAMSGSIRAKGATVVIQPDLPPAYGDPTAVEQVFGNLVGNAVNYLDAQRPGHIEVGCIAGHAGDGLNTYFVRDNGLGIASAHLGRMFSAFQRLHGNVAQGEGVGLALVKRVVERHGGRIWVESSEGVGSTFFVALPAQPGQAGLVNAA
ncbi:ATP-binding protein [Herbaspirillum sp. YR522]|uniref:sensor histidine kinase n=1 Tax=Herbaspirillum sp. YR522 TaxID=1144342 RepID=UPI00026F53FD|nr:ATP-binding protein [Herbaspirillum sp. YR522]EJM98631.1 bacteriophytochrome (light-regulated signal transduction histidine kinase) [Herbaspirillum sp. YR522]